MVLSLSVAAIDAGRRASLLRSAPALVMLGLVLAPDLACGAAPMATTVAAAAAFPSIMPDFHGLAASSELREVASWVITTRDNHAMPFIVIDKVNARVFVFDRIGTVLGATAALLGLAHGDDSVPGIGQRKLATITPQERTTPAGRFEASLGQDFEQDLLWIDYGAALSLHRVIVANPRDHRAERLASPSVLDNRISYGCINVPAVFYDTIVAPAFKDTVGIVYILPETRSLSAVFAMAGPAPVRLASVR